MFFFSCVWIVFIITQLFQTRVKIISVDGNIGSGKSTFIRKLKERFGEKYVFVDEPVSEWMKLGEENGDNILGSFYKDKKRWSYTFQNMCFITRTRALVSAIKEKSKSFFSRKPLIVICERSIFTDRNVFAKMLFDSGFISKMEFSLYDEWFDFMKKETTLDGIIYLNTSPEKCDMRTRLRNRSEEDNIPLEYLISLGKYHDEWVENSECPTLKINGNVEFENDDASFNKMIEDTEDFINWI